MPNPTLTPNGLAPESGAACRLLAELHGQPWMIHPQTLGRMQAALLRSDLEAFGAIAGSAHKDDDAIEVRSGVAILPVSGVMVEPESWFTRSGYACSYQRLEHSLHAALDRDDVRAVVMLFATPGGSAVGCKRLGDQIYAARGAKPIVGYTQEMMASAGYYLGAACDRLEATADAMVGSIGTIYTHAEYSGALEEMGVGVTVITNAGSPKKGHGNPYTKLEGDALKTLQGFVDAYGESFLADAARFRGRTPEQVAESFGQGDVLRGDRALAAGLIDRVSASLDETLAGLSGGAPANPPANQSRPPLSSGAPAFAKPPTGDRAANNQANAAAPAPDNGDPTMNDRIKAQLFAMGIVNSPTASDAECHAALAAWCQAKGVEMPEAEADRLAMLQAGPRSDASDDDEEEDDDTVADEDGDDEDAQDRASRKPGAGAKRGRPNAEQHEAKLADLRASAALINQGAGRDVVTDAMVLDAAEARLTPNQAVAKWNEALSSEEKPLAAAKVTVREGADRYAADAIEALAYRASDSPPEAISSGAAGLLDKPLDAIAADCLRMAGHEVSPGANPEQVAENAMRMGGPGDRHTFYSSNEDRRYVQAAGGPAQRPGDFPNILSGLANRFLDAIELDDDYSFTEISALMPGGLRDFKPSLMVNKGIVEELDEIPDAEQIQDIGMQEEVLSYVFLRRFGNRFGWTPVMIANDDLGAFAEGMIGLREAWMVTQNRLVLDRFTANEQLLDGNPLFADRPDTGTAKNNNDVTSGANPSDASWGAMESAYADIGGIGTGRRVRGALNVALVPTGGVHQEARRTFMPLNAGGLEPKSADTTANVGIYRGQVRIIHESELRTSATNRWFGLRNPTRLNTATVVRAYFNGYGAAGRRERWYDPETKTTYVSLEGRIGVATKNWRYAVRNAGAPAS
ncbi:MAG: S49 family peptidase [Planctomycetota bacterium]